MTVDIRQLKAGMLLKAERDYYCRSKADDPNSEGPTFGVNSVGLFLGLKSVDSPNAKFTDHLVKILVNDKIGYFIGCIALKECPPELTPELNLNE
ncbi:MAG: hypothetical protein GWN01_16300, partial [Nitrosopumilaceae archaeon]|nr:hypothetical protein [Nitrosopumilaceae archaeon]NIU88854.1 hypothetical protein [Nitrosopumilaceae archaeon]NIV66978.1 hypothetical protein [Nitrosopumilaceae archaeon]NIX62998.1 hypothetical protein [Nitrosopumilaceae archaeon]